MPKKSKFQPTLADLEEIYPAGQKHLAKVLGVSTRTLRYWKTGERHPTKEHVLKLIHKKVSADRYINLVQDNYNLTRKQAVKKVKRFYKGADKDKPEQTETDKWIPAYKKERVRR